MNDGYMDSPAQGGYDLYVSERSEAHDPRPYSGNSFGATYEDAPSAHGKEQP